MSSSTSVVEYWQVVNVCSSVVLLKPATSAAETDLYIFHVDWKTNHGFVVTIWISNEEYLFCVFSVKKKLWIGLHESMNRWIKQQYVIISVSFDLSLI